MATNKNSADVIIGGKVYTLTGYVSEEYLQKIANYINGKMAEFEKSESFNRLTTDYKNILMQINIADDYFSLQKDYNSLKDEVSTREKDLYDLKHELIATQMKLESTEKNLSALTEQNDENEKKIIRLETEMKTRMEDTKKN